MHACFPSTQACCISAMRRLSRPWHVVQMKQKLQTPKMPSGGVQKRVSTGRPSTAPLEASGLIKAVSLPTGTPQTRSRAAATNAAEQVHICSPPMQLLKHGIYAQPCLFSRPNCSSFRLVKLTSCTPAGAGSGGGSRSICRPVPEEPPASQHWDPRRVQLPYPHFWHQALPPPCHPIPDQGQGRAESTVSGQGQEHAQPARLATWHPQSHAQVSTRQGSWQR